MKVFVIGSGVAFRRHDQKGVTAVNIVLHELLKSLTDLGHDLDFQIIFNGHRASSFLNESEQAELDGLQRLGVKVLPPIYPEQYQDTTVSMSIGKRAGRLLRRLLIGAKVEDFYAAIRIRGRVCERVGSSKADAILTVWSPEGVAATHGYRGAPRIAFQGDVDFAPGEARMRDAALFLPNTGSSGWHVRAISQRLRQEFGLEQFKQAHLQLMKEVTVIANVTASNAEFYAAHGHRRPIYIRNIWSDVGVGWARLEENGRHSNAAGRPIKIIGHVGYLSQTGSTYGLRFLLAEVVPALKDVMAGLDYEVHIIGGGEVAPALKPLTNQERVVMRGYVDDLDAELASADVFLLLNNAGRYIAAYTRHLVAWSTGLCLVVHANSKKAIPEIVHMENALVGSTAVEVAQMIRLAATDKLLNERIRLGGRATYEKHFTPAAVARALSAEMSRLVAERAEKVGG